MKTLKLFGLIALILLLYFPLFAQVSFSEGNSNLYWPFKDSYFIGGDDAANGWEKICGTNCGLHRQGDIYAQDWLISSCRHLTSTCGRDLIAPFSGKVVLVDFSQTSYGNQIIIQSSQNEQFAMRFAHLQLISVKNGQTIETGDLIGKIGDTGNGGCHTHFALYRRIQDTIPEGSITYLEYMIANPRFRPPSTDIAAPFTFDAGNEKVTHRSNLDGSLIYFDRPHQISGEVTNQSARKGRSILLYLAIENVITQRRIQNKAWVVPIELNPTEILNYQFDNVFEEEGTFDVNVYYQLADAEDRCAYDELMTRRVNVFSEDFCLHADEPNNNLAEASIFVLPPVSQTDLTIHSYATPNDPDYFSFQVPKYGTLNWRSNVVNLGSSFQFMLNGQTISREALIAGVSLQPDDECWIKIESTNAFQSCVDYELIFDWETIASEVLFPNPNNGNFVVEVALDDVVYQARIYTPHGQSVYETAAIRSEAFRLQFETALESGIYILSLERDGAITGKYKMLVY